MAAAGSPKIRARSAPSVNSRSKCSHSSPPTQPPPAASSKRVNLPRKTKGMLSTGPLRCLAMISSVCGALFVGDFALLLEKIRPVNEQHHVGVLLDGARFAQGRQVAGCVPRARARA